MTEKKKPNRRGVFLGGYLSPEIMKYVTDKAKREHKTASRVLNQILLEHIEREQLKQEKLRLLRKTTEEGF
jgi:hypothetical protein